MARPWGMTDEIQMEGSYVGKAEDWPHYKAGASKVAHQRLSDLYQIITTTVNQFARDVWEQVEDFDGESDSTLGAGLFSALTSIIASAIPSPGVGVAAVVAFRDMLVAGVSGHVAEATATRHKEARAQLRHVANELATSTQQAAYSAWTNAVGRIDDDLDTLFELQRDKWGPLEYDDNATFYEGLICDEIGIRDAHVWSPAADITGALWAAWIPEISRVSLKVKWEDMSHTGKLQYLVDNQENFDKIMRVLNLDADWWRIAMEHYLDPAQHRSRTAYDG